MSVKKLEFCINNHWRESKTENYMPVYNTSTGELIAEAPCCTVDEVNEAVEAAKAAYPKWSSAPIQRRTELMFRYKRILEDHMEELAVLVATEQGKTLSEAKGEVSRAIECVEFACGFPAMMQGDILMQVAHGVDTATVREPLGVFAGIAPANFPAMIPFGWMIPLCITAGNTFVLKAASKVPQTGNRMLELLIEAGLPEGVLNIVTCSRNEAELFLEHPDVKGISYVGSTAVGKHIYTKAAANGKRVQALCEAKNHALVMKDANLEKSAQAVISSAFGAAGQRCMALPVVVCEEEIADEFISLVVKYAKELKMGPAYKACTQLGPVGSAEHKNFIINWINKGIKEGAQLVLDGRDIVVPGLEGGYFVGPTILDHVKPGMSVGEREIFGPVLCIKRVKDFEEGLALANANEFANGSVIFTESGQYAREFARRSDGGMVGVNLGIPTPAAFFPFSGHKNSFFGDLHCTGKDGIAFYTEAKCITTRWFGKADDTKLSQASEWEQSLAKPVGCSGV